MNDLSKLTHHPALDEIVNVLCARTQNSDRSFFNVEVAYFLSKIASCMRVSILTKDRGEIPINAYVIDLGASGLGKGHSVNIMEEEFLKGFKNNFLTYVMPEIAERNLTYIAGSRCIKNNTTQEEELTKAEHEYSGLGPYPFTFDSGTSPAVKQLRQKLLMAGSGAINFQCDEIGSNLIGNTEVLNTFLELFDKGLIKIKLTKHTNESKRGEDIEGSTPANMLLFGTPVKVFDGSTTEDAFYSFLEIGYARRCLFGMGKIDKKSMYSKSAAQIFNELVDPANQDIIDKWSVNFTNLANTANFGRKLNIDDSVSIALIEYKINCEKKADLLPDHEDIQKAELSHRYFKALKLAGAYAFIDNSLDVTMTHIEQAIKLVEESGEAFQAILTREKPYMKLANYLADIGREVTHADLNIELPFYKSSVAARNEMMSMAQAWGYRKNIIIKKTYLDDIEFFSGERLKETSLDSVMFSVSTDLALEYQAMEVKFSEFYKLTQHAGLHWCNHAFKNGHRTRDNVIPGFNLVVIDVDTGFPISSARELLKSYTYLMYETKRNTPELNRYRIIMPINYILKLSTDDYKGFINNILEWLPFNSDEGAHDPERKWLTCDTGNYYYNDGELLDALQFIPKTSKNEAYRKKQQEVQNMPALEKWLIQDVDKVGRNNTLIKYALVLLDSGKNQEEIEKTVLTFNKKFPIPLPEDEIKNSIFVTIAKKIASQ